MNVAIRLRNQRFLVVTPVVVVVMVEQKQYNEKEARDVMATLLEAIVYCHDRHIAHRDLKVGTVGRKGGITHLVKFAAPLYQFDKGG